ncbi:MAG: hypothetical protein M3Q30_13855 [Actinomycetota bacterium]|nr:hypothetical protein [Actinomycetota bacterium]
MTGDIELPPSQALDAARPDKQPTAEDKMRMSGFPLNFGADLDLYFLMVVKRLARW